MTIIKVSAQPGLVKANPDPAFVDQFTEVEWEFDFAGFYADILKVDILRFEIYFGIKSPFTWNKMSSSITIATPQKRILPVTGKAIHSGNHKYGIRVVDEKKTKILADDDPWLIVRPR